MELAISKARKTGVGIVTVNNSNHFGIGCYHGMLASSQQMIGVCMTNASPLVAPTNGKSRMLGTNPITVVIPALNNPPFVADLATSAAANGKLELLQRKNLSAPAGWMQDAEGMPSNDPHILKHGGALIGLGSTPDTGMHKGYCLGAFVDIFSGVLSGANYGPWVPPFVSFLPLVSNPVGKGIGHFFMAIDIDAFRDRIEFLEHMDRWMDAFKSSEPIHKDEPVMIPGEPEFKQEIIRSENGIPLLHTVVLDLEDLGQKLGIDFTP
jgi:LDH2 family malate/lactate/ureidoglycolate dehydrogenase